MTRYFRSQGWRWRESNPRPSSYPQGFSGCSLCCGLLGPSDPTGEFAAGPSRLGVPVAPTTKATSSGSLVDASYRAESTPGLTDLNARSGGEGEVGALGIGTYGLRRAFTR